MPGAFIGFFLADNKVNLEEVCSGKKVVIFGVPGAFTPGCSKAHLPGRGLFIIIWCDMFTKRLKALGFL